MPEIVITLLTTVGAAILRNFIGWLENVMEESSEGGKKITNYEWAKLGSTTFRITMIGIALAYGFDLGPIMAAADAVILDFILMAIKNIKKG